MAPVKFTFQFLSIPMSRSTGRQSTTSNKENCNSQTNMPFLAICEIWMRDKDHNGLGSLSWQTCFLGPIKGRRSTKVEVLSSILLVVKD